MNELFYLPETMLWPLLACLVLTGIHVYLGVHVIARKVIFVDLALAQIAALGTVIGVLLGFEVGKDTTALYLYSLAFTIFGAFIFSATRMKGEKVPHEAIIGIVYAVTFAATILVLSRSALGPQELDHIIKGELLWVQAPTVLKTAIIYACVGAFHFAFRKKFMAISFDPAAADASGLNVRLWDFLFYMSFGFVITSSVAIAGVFLVFSYLVIPSVAAMLLTDRLGMRLALGWIGGSLISFLGVKLSYTTGLPTSPLIVVIFAAALLGTAALRYLRIAQRPAIALRNIAAALAVVALFVAGVWLFRKHEESPLEHALHLLSSPLATDRTTAIGDLPTYEAEQAQWLPLVRERMKDEDAQVRKAAIELLGGLGDTAAVSGLPAALRDPSDDVRRAAVAAARRIGTPSVGDSLCAAAAGADDPEMKLSLLEASVHLGSRCALPLLVGMYEEGGIFGGDAYGILRKHLDVPLRADETEKFRVWWKENAPRLEWSGSSQMFVLPGRK